MESQKKNGHNKMHKYFLGAFIAFIVMFLAMLAFAQEGPKAQLYSKPVICASTENNLNMQMLTQIKADGMNPLMYWRGNSYNEDGTKFTSDFFILFDAEDDQVVVLERQDNGFHCIVSGGTGNITFDPQKLSNIIGWSDIP